MKKYFTLALLLISISSFAQQNVGIGTTNPLQKLEIGGTTNTLRIDGIGTGGTFLTAPASTTNAILYANTLGDVSSIPPGSNGNVLSINGSGLIQWLAPTTLSAGTGINIVGNSINSLWTASGNNIFNNNNSGAGFVGIGTNGTPNTMLDVNGSVAFRQGTALALVNGTNSNVTLGANSFFRITGPTAAFTITGLTGGVDGRIVTLYNTTAFAMTIVNNATSTAANEILTNTGGNIVSPAANSVVQLQYNATAARWILIGSANLTGTAWSTSGNSGLTSDFGNPVGGSFLGNSDGSSPISFRLNNTRAGFVDNTTSAGSSSTFLGYLAGNYGTYGSFTQGPASYENVYIGYSAGTANGSASAEANNNVGIGWYADAANTTGVNNTLIGSQAFEYSTGSSNVAVGSGALRGSSSFTPGSGSLNTAVGINALYACADAGTGNNVAVGANIGGSSFSGTQNTFLGANSAGSTSSCTNNTFVGYSAGSSVGAGSSNVFLGASSGVTGTAVTTGTQNTFLGTNTGGNAAAIANATAIGYNAAASASNQVVLGNTSVTTTEFAGALMPYYSAAYHPGTANQVLVSQGTGVAPQWTTLPAGWALTGNSGTTSDFGLAGNFIGTTDAGSSGGLGFRVNNVRAGFIDNLGSQSVFLGVLSGNYGTWGTFSQAPASFENVYIGYHAGTSNGSASTQAPGNVGIGWNADASTTVGAGNTSVGWSAFENQTGSFNTSLGYEALEGPTAFLGGPGSGTYNVALGYTTGFAVSTGQYNTIIGEAAAPNLTTGSRNIYIGNGAGTTSLGGTNGAALNDHLVIESTKSTALWNSATAPVLLSGNFAAATIGLSHAVTHDAEYGTVSLNGHLDVQAGMTGTGAAQGTNNMLAATATYATFTDATVTVANNSTDVTGTVSVNVNTATGTGSATFTFGHAYTNAPFVSLTPSNANAAGAAGYWVTSTTTGFTINFTGTASTTYAFNYLAVETTK